MMVRSYWRDFDDDQFSANIHDHTLSECEEGWLILNIEEKKILPKGSLIALKGSFRKGGAHKNIGFICKGTAILFLLSAVIVFGMTGCGKEKYRVDYDGMKEFYGKAKDSYPAGAKVTVYYDLIATDTDYSFYLDGEYLQTEYDEKKGFVITFTMPAHDVKLECRTVNSMATYGCIIE